MRIPTSKAGSSPQWPLHWVWLGMLCHSAPHVGLTESSWPVVGVEKAGIWYHLTSTLRPTCFPKMDPANGDTQFLHYSQTCGCLLVLLKCLVYFIAYKWKYNAVFCAKYSCSRITKCIHTMFCTCVCLLIYLFIYQPIPDLGRSPWALDSRDEK